METNLKVTLKWAGETGDGKRAFIIAEQNDGWQDVRLELDTDDCDGDHAKAAMQVVIDRCNSHAALVEALETAQAELIFWQEHNRDAENPMIGPGQSILATLKITRAALAQSKQ